MEKQQSTIMQQLQEIADAESDVSRISINLPDDILYDFEPLSFTEMKSGEYVASKYAPAWQSQTGFYYIFTMKTDGPEYAVLVNSKFMDALSQLSETATAEEKNIMLQFAIGMLETCVADDIWTLNGEVFSQTEFGKKMNEELNSREVHISISQLPVSAFAEQQKEETTNE